MKTKLLFFVFFTATLSLFGQERSVVDAEAIAARFAVKSASGNARFVKKTPKLVHTAKSDANKANYYAFEYAGNNGYVIVSGDERLEAVLGYADRGEFDLEKMPSNMKEWLKGYEAEIEALVEVGEEGDVMSDVEGEPTPDAVAPLLGDIEWGQGEPFNGMCPDMGEERAVTGCVATAMAQIMKYHEWPVTGTGTHTNGNNHSLVVDYSATTYDWANMTGGYDEYSTQEEMDAVAELMYHCGVAVDMIYGANSSSSYDAHVLRALKKNFGYDDGVRLLERKLYTYDEWVQLFKVELSEGRPLYHAGSSGSSGHAFVCDGYDEDDYFHINWGWNGYFNGYFKLTALVPQGAGIGAAVSNDYTPNQKVVAGIQRPDGNDADYHKYPFVMDKTPQITYSRLKRGTESTQVEIRLTDLFNQSDTIYNGAIGVTLFEEDMTEMVGDISSFSANLKPNWGWESKEVDLWVGKNVEVGNYRLYAIYKVDATTWDTVPVSKSHADYVEVEVTADSIFFTDVPGYEVDLEVLDFSVQPGELYNNRHSTFKVMVKNNGIEYASHLDLCVGNPSSIYSKSNVIMKCPVAHIVSGDSVELTYKGLIDLRVGDEYDVQLYYDENNNYEEAKVPLGEVLMVAEIKTEPDPISPRLNAEIAFEDNENVPTHGARLRVKMTNDGGWGEMALCYDLLLIDDQVHSSCDYKRFTEFFYIGENQTIDTVIEFDFNEFSLCNEGGLIDGECDFRLMWENHEGAASWIDYISGYGYGYIKVNIDNSLAHTLSYDLDGGYMFPDKGGVKVVKGWAIGNELFEPMKTGYVFEGWEVDGELVDMNTVWKYDEDKVAVAKWAEDERPINERGYMTGDVESNVGDWDIMFKGWTQYDFDGGEHHTHLGPYHYEGAFISYNPTSSDAYELTMPGSIDIVPHSGDRCLACITTLGDEWGPNDDWLITPKTSTIEGGDKFSAYVMTGYRYQNSEYRILVSTEGTDVEDFECISGEYALQAPTHTWTQVEYDLSEYEGMQIYIAMQVVDVHGYYFLVDDIVFPFDVNDGPVTTYTLKFDARGGSEVDDMYIKVGEAVGDLPISYKAGHTLVGWEVDSVAISDTTIWNYTETKTAVAQWEVSTGVDVDGEVDVIVSVRDADVVVEGAREGDVICVYAMNGAMVRRVVALGDEVKVAGLDRGVYVVRCGSGVVRKVVM